jgi:hypothetical protein
LGEMRDRLEVLLQTYSFQPFCELLGVRRDSALETMLETARTAVE